MHQSRDCSDLFREERKFTCCRSNRTPRKSKKENLLNTLKNLKPKYNTKVFNDYNDFTDEFSSRKDMESEENHLHERKLFHNKRNEMSFENNVKVPHDVRFSYNRKKKVCDRTNESSRSSKKVHCNCYDQSQGIHYSRRYFEKFPYAAEVTCSGAMSSYSSLDDSGFRMKKKPLFRNNKEEFGKIRENKKYANLTCYSFKKSALDKLGRPQRPPDSSYSELFKLESEVPKDRKEISGDGGGRNSYGKNFGYDCCCGVGNKVKAGCSYYCKCSDYSECSDPPRNHSVYQSRYEDYSKCCEKNRAQNYIVGESEYNNNSKEGRNYEDESATSNGKYERFKKSSHWNQGGQYKTKAARKYRYFSNKSKLMQLPAEHQFSNDSNSKRLTRTYPSREKFTSYVKSAQDAVTKSRKESRCECKDNPSLLETLKNCSTRRNTMGSKILNSYNILKNSSNPKNLSDSKKMNDPNNSIKRSSRKIIGGQCQGIHVFCPEDKSMSLKSKINKKQLSHAKTAQKEVLNSPKDNSGHRRRKCEKRKPEDKILGDDKKQELNTINFPRILKSREGSCKVNLNKIFIYPSHGEEGSPLTLHKKFSNIDCRIKGNETKGFRYQVTYKQRFISPVWHPKELRSPFRKKKNNTDYG